MYRWYEPHYRSETQWPPFDRIFSHFHEISQKIVPSCPIHNKLAMVQVMTWCRTDKPGHRSTQIAKFMVPTWGPSGSCRPQMGPMLAAWNLLSGYVCVTSPPWITMHISANPSLSGTAPVSCCITETWNIYSKLPQDYETACLTQDTGGCIYNMV